MDASTAVTISTVVTDATSIMKFFIDNLGTIITATPVVLIPAALMLIRASVKNTKSLLFYGKGRRG